MERKRIIVSYGDIRGFSPWIKRPFNAPEDMVSLMGAIYDEFETFANSSGGVAKYVGDSLMVIKELGPGHNCTLVRDFMRKSFFFADAVQKIILTHWPRPVGFRLRMVSGYVYKRKIRGATCVSGKLCGRAAHSVEYIGYPLNLAQRLLYVATEELCICHESVHQILGAVTNGLKFTLLGLPKKGPRGVDPTDLEELRSFRVEGGSENFIQKNRRKNKIVGGQDGK